MRNRLMTRMLAAIGLTIATVTTVGVGISATSSTAGAAPVCTFSVSSGPGTIANTNPWVITGAVAGTTNITSTCTGIPGSAVMVETSDLAAIVTPTSDQANEADQTHLAFLSGGTATFSLPAPFAAPDTNATCPPSAAQINAGLIGCTVAVAAFSGASYGAVQVVYNGSPSPASPPTLVLTPTSATPGEQVTVSEIGGHTNDWWGNYANNQPISASGITVGGGAAGTSSTQVGAASYNGATHVLTPGPLGGSFTVPCSATNGVQAVHVTEPNTTGTAGSIVGAANITINGAGGGCLSSVSPNQGPTTGGTSVTITGVGFTGVTAVHFGTVPATSFHFVSDTTITAVSPPGTGRVAVNVTTPAGTTSTTPNLNNEFQYGFNGYDLTASDGGVFTFGDAAYHGSLSGKSLNGPIVGSATTSDGGGYWLAGSDGGVYAFGDAAFYGSQGGTPLVKPIVGISATPDGKGYWLVASDGGVFAFGDATFFGSAGGRALNAPVVGMASTPDGGGYWLVGADGGVFSYGNAPFHGSAGGTTLNAPIVGITSADAGGYWLVGSDGGVFSYGDAPFHGSAAGTSLNAAIVAIQAVEPGGYWLMAADGGVFSYGDAPYFGSMGATPLNAPINGGAAA